MAASPEPHGGDDIAPAPVETPKLLTKLNRHGFRIVMVLDAVALFALAVIIMLVRFGTTWPSFSVPMYFTSFAVSVAIFSASWYLGGLYDREPRLGAPPVLPRAARQALAAGSLVALLNLGLTGLAQRLGLVTQRALPFPVVNLVILIAAAALVVVVNRGLVDAVRTRREGPPKIILAGDAEDLLIARRHLLMETSKVVVVAEVSSAHAIIPAAAEGSATDVVLVSAGWLDELYPDIVAELDAADVTTLMRVSGRETLLGLRRLRQIGGLPFVLLQPQTIARSQLQAKRLLDLVVLVLTSPVWVAGLALAAAYQLAVAGWPLLYRQERVGVGGETFDMLKFRTMAVDAEADGEGARLSSRGDVRVIPACRWIRATRVDELPQLWNIAKGEMSFVGPRPERPELTAGFERRIAGYTRRHEVPPGLTGLAQIHGRYHTDPEYKLGYDLQYLVNWSPVLDLEIMLQTIWVVLARRV